MGWKTFKEYFGINHIVRIEEGKLCIGSPYIYDLASISIETGKIVPKRHSSFDGFLKEYYPAIAEASPESIKELLAQEDVFDRSIEVYTFDYETYDILTKYCEATGYPNVTHDGCLMHDNEYFEDKNIAINRAKESLAGVIEWRSRRVAELEKELLEAKTRLVYFKGRAIT
jgi:hypothetical protein